VFLRGCYKLIVIEQHKISDNMIISLIIVLVLILRCSYYTHTQVISNYMAVALELSALHKTDSFNLLLDVAPVRNTQ